jgi:CO dehydrogenase maturation factor
LLRAFEESSDTVVIADLEAGIGSLTRMAERHIDKVVVACEPTVKSVQAATRALEQADRLGIPAVIAANRVASDDDEAFIRGEFKGRDVVVIPDDAFVTDSDRLGLAPIDHAPDCPAVGAIRAMVTVL